ncbi:kelch-like protein 17 [Glandiceps talaboti]
MAMKTHFIEKMLCRKLSEMDSVKSLRNSPTSTLAKQTLECVTHVSTSHCQDAFVAMYRMRQRGVLCDITLKVGLGRIPAHKLVLASCSPYFQAMFTSDMSECRQPEITMHDVDCHALELLVKFAYTAEVTVTEKNVQTLLPAASLLQLHTVREACCRFLMDQLDPTNCLGIRRFADTHGCYELQQTSHKFALLNFTEVSQSEEFHQLPKQEVLDLISSDQLNVMSEELVFEAVIRWISHDVTTRGQYTAELTKFVRLPLLSRDFFMNHVESNNIVRTCVECKDYLIEAMKYHLCPEQRAILQSPRTRERRAEGLTSMLFSIGGGSLFAIHSECECYDARKDRWTTVAPMTTRRARLGVGVIAGQIYAVGGYDGTNDLASVECYCVYTNMWQTVEPLGTRRSCVGVGIMNGLLFAMGGYDGASCLNSCERYDPLTNIWTSIAPMVIRRRYVRVGVADGCLYAVGGYDGSTHLSSVERFDPTTNRWTTVASMLSRRSSAGVAILDGMLYVVGGNDGSSCLSSMERYNSRLNQWEPLPSMNVRRSTHDVIVMEGYLYAIGGNDGSSSLNSVERYDPNTNKWTMISSMTTRRSSVAVAVADVISIPLLTATNV